MFRSLHPTSPDGKLSALTLPNFLIIGANKGATTSLRAYLGEHPDVFVPSMIEPSFFAIAGRPRTLADGSNAYVELEREGAAFSLEEYEAMFEGVTTESAIGEKSTAYLTSPHAPHRIKELIPDVKLVAILRNPVERAFSHYLMEVRWGHERLSFDEAVAAERDRKYMNPGGARHYVRSGRYANRVERYQGLFRREQFRIYLFEDMQTDTPAVVREVFEYIGVDPDFEPDLNLHHNARPPRTARPRMARRIASALSQPSRLKPPSTSSRMTPKTREELVDFYREDILKLQTLIDRDLTSWMS